MRATANSNSYSKNRLTHNSNSLLRHHRFTTHTGLFHMLSFPLSIPLLSRLFNEKERKKDYPVKGISHWAPSKWSVPTSERFLRWPSFIRGPYIHTTTTQSLSSTALPQPSRLPFRRDMQGADLLLSHISCISKKKKNIRHLPFDVW